ncbi:MAG: RdgB/HAM1 family non-canonical purine NTP pyrophosphatase [Sodaliphilus pleomorphus]|jgi:XTP/dITP diphosphohydrolase|uniref:RdgB/HAM1 family non-canonical purine NTP pyrophosphatase n=1 Tax=Sodaliphilus pleomorphus TaxID=2606626 RepID=UPI00240A47C9|nr:RdgB/HAM1 family non-canonical purine NTP pyrophosphatase [Sodaliphilus pleomorphus]MCI5979847.1 RdgB/HAM1 family non-canonical purine NTP pyrophosphatase [Muribaculaceae bacterium]MDD6475052.1 RdgB/HAM1 family non-canonical purine NTP pyrophosphatase [Sodaliphilus pleomorphus]MDD6687687.1 RdgB/HAM1 family non-canonical purine NTP pyrophosphatase [Sodaliphilus pleomorphus]
MREIVFATNNEHKLQELREIVGHKFNILSLAQIGCHDDIPETASTIEGNAEMKARYVKQHYGYDCFSDDTGLEIDALGGEPGVYSARYAGPGHDSEANIDKVLAKLQGVPPERRTARFRTAVALLQGQQLHIFEGKVEGHILTERHGTGGFGYDSIFAPVEGRGLTFAQMQPQEKNAMSHRGRAVARLVQFLASQE